MISVKPETIAELEKCLAMDLQGSMFETAAATVVQLIRAVIADELPNIAKAVLNHPLDKLGDPIECDTFAEALAPQPVAAGDVPKLPSIEDEIEKSIRWLFPLASASTVAEAIRYVMSHRWSAKEAAEAEISRRVAEAVAPFMQRLDDIRTKLKRSGNGLDEGTPEYQIGELFRKLYESAGVRGGDNPIVEAVASLKQQLAAAQAEVERLKGELDAGTEYHARFSSKVDAALGSPRYSGDLLSNIVTGITTLREEVSRLSRPVEGVDWQREFAKYIYLRSEGKMLEGEKAYCAAVEPLLQSERNARESAERERDELREACNGFIASCNEHYVNDEPVRKYAAITRHGRHGRRTEWDYDTPADAVLAAYRAEKGKVQA